MQIQEALLSAEELKYFEDLIVIGCDCPLQQGIEITYISKLEINFN